MSPIDITGVLYENLEWLRAQAFSMNEQVRVFSAELWSLALINNLIKQQASLMETADSTNTSFDKLFASLLSINEKVLNNSSKSFEAKHGGLLCIGFAVGKYFTATTGADSMDRPVLYETQLRTLILSVIGLVDEPNLNAAAIMALGEMARNGRLVYESAAAKLSLVDSLIKKIQTSKETSKLKEKAAATLGYLCIHEDQTSGQYKLDTKIFNTFNKYVMQKLLDSSQAKQVELHMSIGEALANCALGRYSMAGLNTWQQTSTEMSGRTSEEGDDSTNMSWLLNELLNTYMPHANQHLRQAASFWLLIFIKKCSKSSLLVSKSLYRIQEAFIQRLGENDEITQEVSSKGIGIIFSLATEEQKKHLVEKLVDTLGGGGGKTKKPTTAINLTSVESGLKIKDENEEIFQADQMGKAPDGSNIGSYKELCSLASDMNRLTKFLTN